MILSVDVDSAADKVGLKPGDQVVCIDGHRGGWATFPEVLQRLDLGHNLRLTVLRGVSRERAMSTSVQALHGEL